ncbi:hypothetical protein L6R21_06905 [bacterium]|nr:hypothetical protein [bacterium]
MRAVGQRAGGRGERVLGAVAGRAWRSSEAEALLSFAQTNGTVTQYLVCCHSGGILFQSRTVLNFKKMLPARHLPFAFANINSTKTQNADEPSLTSAGASPKMKKHQNKNAESG